MGRGIPVRAAVHDRDGEPEGGAPRTLDGARERARAPAQHGHRGALRAQDRRDGPLQHRELQVRPARG